MTGQAPLIAQTSGELSFGEGLALLAFVALVLLGLYLAERLFDAAPDDLNDDDHKNPNDRPGAP